MDPANCGILVVDKPAGITSHDAVAQVRREHRGKVGHSGTLDPFATGVLLVLIGRATRLQRYLTELPKTYRAEARLGWRSSTGDPDGELERTGRIPSDLSLPTGKLSQMVPMTSAVKVGGERLYKKAHRGEIDVDRPVREVTVHRAELLSASGEEAEYEVEVSSGTYVRTLIETLGDAYCASLRRIAVGPIGIERAGDLLSPFEGLSFLPRFELQPEQVEAIGFGRTIPVSELRGEPNEGAAVALVHEDRLIAVARKSVDTMRPEVVLEPAQ